ncbi:hypothetical protein VNO77_03135 [Canavalia gladiata]|uniref:Uncharacterized protein n=1 Tax=Canavalia gladiata TaxID=3824 RepID=A0AAN9N0N3_CANGL
MTMAIHSIYDQHTYCVVIRTQPHYQDDKNEAAAIHFTQLPRLVEIAQSLTWTSSNKYLRFWSFPVRVFLIMILVNTLLVFGLLRFIHLSCLKGHKTNSMGHSALALKSVSQQFTPLYGWTSLEVATKGSKLRTIIQPGTLWGNRGHQISGQGGASIGYPIMVQTDLVKPLLVGLALMNPDCLKNKEYGQELRSLCGAPRFAAPEMNMNGLLMVLPL